MSATQQAATTTAIPDRPSPQSKRLTRVYRRYVRPFTERWSPRGYRLSVARLFADAGALTRLSRGTRVWRTRYGTVRGTWVDTPRARASDGVLLQLHGGGFTFGSPRSHKGMAHGLSIVSGLPAFLPAYRLAPKHPFPAAADDCLAAYRALLDGGFEPTGIRLVGDSAGGHLVCGLLADLAREGLPLPSAAAVFSPMLDLTCRDVFERDHACRDPFISPHATAASAAAYAGETPLDDPRLDVLAADKVGWPRFLIQSGELECLRGDAERLARSLADASVPCEYQVWPGQMHAFQAFADFVPESRSAIRYAGEFLRGRRCAHSASSVLGSPARRR